MMERKILERLSDLALEAGDWAWEVEQSGSLVSAMMHAVAEDCPLYEAGLYAIQLKLWELQKRLEAASAEAREFIQQNSKAA